MKRRFKLLIFVLCLRNSQVNAFGGVAEIPYLVQLVTENIKRYEQLKMMMEMNQGQNDYVRLINAGLENSMGLLQALPVSDENITPHYQTFHQSHDSVLKVYGKVPPSREAEAQVLHDKTVAESLKMAGEFKRYAREQEANSFKIAAQGRRASPKGAERMQVETTAQILKSLSQLIKLNTQILKLQSERLAIENKQNKDAVTNHQKLTGDMGQGFNNLNLPMGLHR